jgi:hypothetical protein
MPDSQQYLPPQRLQCLSPLQRRRLFDDEPLCIPHFRDLANMCTRNMCTRMCFEAMNMNYFVRAVAISSQASSAGVSSAARVRSPSPSG